jgi:hypothetical protein
MKTLYFLRTEVLTAVKMYVVVFWVVTCGLLGGDGGSMFLQFQLVTTYKTKQCHNPEDYSQHHTLFFSF